MSYKTLIFVSLISFHSFAQTHDFQTQKYDEMHDSPMQRKFRKIAPMPAGVVYIQQPNEGEKEMREHFRNMKKLGFNALKQIMNLPSWSIENISLIALDEGIIPLKLSILIM
jgi:beta-galactosidase